MKEANEAKRNAERVSGELVNQLMRGLALEGLGRIMQKNPVDTGRSRANWNASVDVPDTSTDDTLRLEDVPARQAEGGAIIAGADFAGGHDVYLTNGLPYIEGLEKGRSQQAPHGMVGVTVEELRPVADQIARRMRR